MLLLIHSSASGITKSSPMGIWIHHTIVMSTMYEIYRSNLLQRLRSWNFGTYKYSCLTFYWACAYLSMVGFKLERVSKSGPRGVQHFQLTFIDHSMFGTKKMPYLQCPKSGTQTSGLDLSSSCEGILLYRLSIHSVSNVLSEKFHPPLDKLLASVTQWNA